MGDRLGVHRAREVHLMGVLEILRPNKPVPEMQRMSLEDLIGIANREGFTVRLWQNGGYVFQPGPRNSWDATVILIVGDSEFKIKKDDGNPAYALALAIDEARKIKGALS